MNAVAAETGVPVSCAGINVHPQLRFDVEDAALARKLSTLYIQEMAKRGCHGYASFYLNASQGEAEIEQTVHAARETFALIDAGLENGRIDELLECKVSEDSFRRLVR
jgi:glutamate-1-semialdehyde 2,1-aminomutase